MFQNYFKVAIRNCWRDKQTTFIHLLGFSLAFAGVLFILLYVNHELGTDAWHTKSDRIFKVTLDETIARADGRHMVTVAPPTGPALKASFPEVKEAVRMRYTDDVILEYQGDQYYENKVWYTDEGFFQMFDFELSHGDRLTALTAPGSVVLTPSIAEKYFGTENPLGKSILLNEETPLEVTGVLANEPSRSHFDFKTLISFSTFKVPFGYPVNLESWRWISFHTYIQLEEGIAPAELEQKFPAFLKEHMEPERAERLALRLQSLQDVYFNSWQLNNAHWWRRGNLTYIYGLAAIAALILLIAGFNFMNLTAARSIRREREVGVRKVLGAGKLAVIRQFTGEAVLIAGLSLAFAVVWFEVGKFGLQNALGWSFDLTTSDYWTLLPALVIVAILIGILAGIYPAIILSKFRPVRILKEMTRRGKSGQRVQKTLLVLQFAIATGLIAATFLVRHQLDFMLNRDLGFDKEQVVSLQMATDDFNDRFQLAKQIFGQNPHISGISAGDIFDGNYGSMPVIHEETEPGQAPALHSLNAYFDYFKTLGIEMVEGREFLEAFPTDTASGIILNETAVKLFGFEEPLGQTLQIGSIKSGQVVGVVKDFHINSLHDPIIPLVVYVPETHMRYILLRLNPGNISEIMASIQSDWEKIAPDLPFALSFLDENIEQSYLADRQFGNMVGLFTVLIILVTCLGLYGLISLLLQYRQKELSIRKILGAPVKNLVWLTSRHYVLPALLSLIIAMPVTWWAMNEYWLNNFAYRIDFPWAVFLLAGCIAVGIALLTVSFQSVKAALANPIDSLRNE